MKIEDYSIFWSLRDKYPACSTIIGDIMSYAFTHNDTIDERYLYLGESKAGSAITEEDIKAIFKEFGIDDIVCLSSPRRSYSHLMVKINSK